jgi:hypothetical protein
MGMACGWLVARTPVTTAQCGADGLNPVRLGTTVEIVDLCLPVADNRQASEGKCDVKAHIYRRTLGS